MTLTVREIAERLKEQAEAVARMLLPAGALKGREWCVGSVNGEPGNSLKVCIEGSKQGVWADFAAGTGGDLLDLWAAVRGLDRAATVREAKDYLGIDDRPLRSVQPKVYRRPDPPKAAVKAVTNEPIRAYLTGERCLSPEVLALYKIGACLTVGPWEGWKRQEPAKGPWIVFPYLLPSGELAGVKYLHLRRKDGKKITLVEPGCEPVCFGWHTIDPMAKEVTICEGELDAATLAQYGYPTLSVPFGGGKGAKQQWIDHDWERLEPFETINLCFDADAAGEEAVAEIVQRLGAHRCRVVKLPHKDANKCLQEGVTKQEIDACFEAAAYLSPPSLRCASDLTDDVLNEFFPPNERAKGLPIVIRTVPFRYLSGEVTIYTGWNGSGKSLFLGQVVLGLMRSGERAVIASLEMRCARTLYRIVRQTTGTKAPTPEEVRWAMESLGEHLWLHDRIGTESVKTLLEVFDYARRRYGVRHFIIDSLMRLGIKEDDYNGQKDAVDQLCVWANATQSHVHLVAHARKRDGEHERPGKMDIKGTGAITDLAFNVISIWRNKPKEEAVQEYHRSGKLPKGVDSLDELEDKMDALLSIEKARNVEDAEGRYPLWFDRSSMQYLAAADDRPSQFFAVGSVIDEPPPF